MSRIGKKPVPIPSGVEVQVRGPAISVSGPKGKLTLELTGAIEAEVGERPKEIRVKRNSEARTERAKHGLYRALLANMVEGVSKGYERRLDIQGVGYRAQISGSQLRLWVGWNTKQPEVYVVPEGLEIECPSPTQIVIRGIDKQLVGQAAASIRAVRPPDVYKGKGIRYLGEQVRKLPGKTVGATGA